MAPFASRPQDPFAAAALGRALGVSATLGQLLLHRGLRDPSDARGYLEARLRDLTPPDGMADRDVAAERIARAIRSGERIVVFGDYDVDGATSAALLAEVIERLGGAVTALAADRFAGGYGFSAPALARCLEAGARLVVTCDCGSSDHERIAEAARAGVDVVVVDHHLVPEDPLPALAFVNPHRPDCGHAYKHMASAGLAFSLAAAVRRQLRVSLDLRPWIDLVAVGTIADVAPLDGDNRRLVRAGLRAMSRGDARPGLRALMRRARLTPARPLGSREVAWRLAPRLNAPGRLGSAQATLDLLMAKTDAEADRLAEALEAANRERRRLGERALREALRSLEARSSRDPGRALVVSGEGWHRGVVGIVAARLADRYGVPVACVALDGDEGHGSVRSAGGVDVHAVLGRCAPLLSRWGGHAAAAGFSLPVARLAAFREAFEEEAAPDAEANPSEVLVDVVLDGDRFPVPTVEEMAWLEPFGERNPEPLFGLCGVRVESARPVGPEGQHLAMTLRVGGQRLRAFGPRLGSRVEALRSASSLLGRLQPDTWRGGEAVQFLIEPPSASR